MRLIACALAAGLALAAPAWALPQLTPAQQQAQVVATGTAVAQFHQQFNAGQFQAIWQASAPMLQQSTSAEAFAAQLAAYHAQVGDYQSHVLIGDMVTDTSLDAVTISYTVTYAKGTAKENFVYLIVNGQPQLARFSWENVQASGG